MKGRRGVTEIVEDIGYGRGQLLASALANGVWLADGAELLILSAVSTSVAKEFKLSVFQEGSLMSSVYLGVLLGSFLSGYIGDCCGRRIAVLLSFPVIALCCLASSMATGFVLLIILRFLVGVGFGTGQPSSVAILMEMTPIRYRVLNQALAQLAFAAGELLCCLALFVDDPSLKSLHWRTLLMLGALPAMVFWVLSWAFLTESPGFLAAKGNRKEAQAVLDGLKQLNDAEDVSTEIDPAHGDPRAAEPAAQGPASFLNWSTVALCFVCFSYNLVVYGSFTAFPQLLPKLLGGFEDFKEGAGGSAAMLAKGALIEVPCDLIGLAAGLLLPRKWVIHNYFLGIIISACLFNQQGNETAVLAGYYGLKGFPQIGAVSLYVLAAESFPVMSRASGTALVLSCGRLGAFPAPVIYEFLAAKNYQNFFLGLCSPHGFLRTGATMPGRRDFPKTHRKKTVRESRHTLWHDWEE